MAYNRGTRHKPKWVGRAEYRGHARWVGTHASLEAYREAERQCLDRLREEVDSAGSPTIPTVLEFAKAVIHDSGHIEMEWPDGQRVHKATGRKDSSVRRLRDGLRPFLREFGPRPIDSFTRREALAWVRPKGANTLQSVRQFFNHALDNDLVPANHFSRVGASKRKRRVDRHDFRSSPTSSTSCCAAPRVRAAPTITAWCWRALCSPSARPPCAPPRSSRSTATKSTSPTTSSTCAGSSLRHLALRPARQRVTSRLGPRGRRRRRRRQCLRGTQRSGKRFHMVSLTRPTLSASFPCHK